MEYRNFIYYLTILFAFFIGILIPISLIIGNIDDRLKIPVSLIYVICFVIVILYLRKIYMKTTLINRRNILYSLLKKKYSTDNIANDNDEVLIFKLGSHLFMFQYNISNYYSSSFLRAPDNNLEIFLNLSEFNSDTSRKCRIKYNWIKYDEKEWIKINNPFNILYSYSLEKLTKNSISRIKKELNNINAL